jgi:hypothetical protein
MILSSFLALLSVLKQCDLALVKHIVDTNLRFFGGSGLKKYWNVLVQRSSAYVEVDEIPSDEDDVLGPKRDAALDDLPPLPSKQGNFSSF